ncbi:MAG: hypothetical protein ABJO09_13440 [Hyphomicrobiales bacterium]
MYRKKFSTLLAASVATTAAFTFAAPSAEAGQGLSGQEIKSKIAGKRIFLRAPLGGEFPLRYRKNGVVIGDGSALGLGKYMAPKESGRWWVQNDQLCQQWHSWYKGKVACFQLFETGQNKLYWKRDDGRSGKARIAN